MNFNTLTRIKEFENENRFAPIERKTFLQSRYVRSLNDKDYRRFQEFFKPTTRTTSNIYGTVNPATRVCTRIRIYECTHLHVHVTGSESPLAYNARARESSRASLLFREDRFSTNFPSLRTTFPKKKKKEKLIRRPIFNLIVDLIAFLFHKLRL